MRWGGDRTAVLSPHPYPARPPSLRYAADLRFLWVGPSIGLEVVTEAHLSYHSRLDLVSVSAKDDEEALGWLARHANLILSFEDIRAQLRQRGLEPPLSLDQARTLILESGGTPAQPTSR